MTTRDDVTVTYTTSPRIAEVDAPSTEITMQDLVDTLRKDEDAFSKGLSFQKLVNASGKENLGGGVSVGITVALQDTKLAFEGRTTPAETGTVTTGSGPPVVGTINFIDTAADFVTAGIERGSMVINYTDQSIADVVEVVSLTELKTKVLVNGISNTYTASDVYDVFNIIQCTALGGNLTAVDSDQVSISQILPTAFTQVVIARDVSAAIVETGVSGLTPTESTQLAKIDTVPGDVWEETATDHLAAGTTGLMLNQIKADTTQLSLDTTTILALATILEKHQTNRTLIDPTAKTLTVFDDDGTTPLKVFDLKDATGGASVVQVFERVPQ